MQLSQRDVERSSREVTSLEPRLGQMHLNNSWPLREKSEGCGKQRDTEMLIAFSLRTHSCVGRVTEKEKDVKHGVRRTEDTNMTT
jgi:hypothetical protein